MRALALAILAAMLCAGCIDPFLGRAPVILLETSFAFEGEGTAEAYPGWRCEMARLDPDRERLVLVRPPGPEPPSLVVLRETGDTWRAANRSTEPMHTLVGLAHAGGGAGSNGFDAVFRDGPANLYTVKWDGRRAWLNETPLDREVPVARAWTYDVPADEGGTLRVTETLRATYLGRLDVAVEAPSSPCP